MYMQRRTGALKRYLCGIRWSTKNCRYIWVKESIQRRRMIIATTQSIRQRKHQSYGAYHRVRQLSSIPRESLNLCRCLWRCCPRTSRNKTGWTRIKGFTRVSSDSNDINKLSITIRCNPSFEGTNYSPVSYFLLSTTRTKQLVRD